MLTLAVIFLLIFSSHARAGHRAALIIGNHQELANALGNRGFIVTSVDDQNHQKGDADLHLFLQGVPTRGIALIYTNQKEPQKLLQRLSQETGADLAIVLSNSEGFAAQLAQEFNQEKKGLIEAIQSAAQETNGWFSTGANVHEPELRRAVFSPANIQPGKYAGDEWVNGYGITFCWCPEKEGGFWMGKYEITLREFNAVTRKNPREALATQPNHPRDGIHWDDISQFVRQLNQREEFFKRIPEGWEYTLPSESQWYHAARAGGFPNDLPRYANFADNSLFNTGNDFYHYADRRMNDGQSGLAVVGSYQANSWGIHDLSGNLWEWTRTFPRATITPESPGHPIACGGSWVSRPEDCTPTARREFPKRTEKNFIGFRLVFQQIPVTAAKTTEISKKEDTNALPGH